MIPKHLDRWAPFIRSQLREAGVENVEFVICEILKDAEKSFTEQHQCDYFLLKESPAEAHFLIHIKDVYNQFIRERKK